MNYQTLRHLGVAALLILLQVTIFNKVHLFGYATPMLYIYILIKTPVQWSRWSILLIAFVVGLILDIFSNTMGLHTASLVAAAMTLPFWVRLLLRQYEELGDITPSMTHPKPSAFMRYALAIILLHHTLLFCLEYFTITHWLPLLLETSTSAMLTLGLVILIDSLLSSQPQETR